MGKKEERRLDLDVRLKKRDKKRKEGAVRKPGIVDVLNCAPVARFHCELVVGNGIGEDAVEDAMEAFKRAWEARRQKAYEAASQTAEGLGKDCEVAERLVVGPFSSAQDWKIDAEAEPMTAMTWCWVGYESIHFCKPR
jgi:hypothetical protein